MRIMITTSAAATTHLMTAVHIIRIPFGEYFLVSIPNSSLSFNFIIFPVSSVCRMTQGDGKSMFT